MYKAYKYRIYPNEDQKAQLARLFGCCRFVYNQTLAHRKEVFEKSRRNLTVRDCIAYYHKEIKPANAWLAEADEPALINAIYHMDLACRQAYKQHRGYPKFKRKHDSRKSYTIHRSTENIVVDFANHTIKLPNMPVIKATLHRTFTGQIKSATISQSWGDHYYVSFVAESEHRDLPHTANSVGLNLRDKNVCVTSDGQEYMYAAPTDKHAKRLAALEKQLKRKEKGSNNYFRLKKEIAICYERITNARTDTLHKISHEIISENQVIISEIMPPDINASDPSTLLIELQKLLEYKAKLNHRNHVKVDMRTIDDLPFSHCDHCDSAQNIAKHILAAGLDQLT